MKVKTRPEWFSLAYNEYALFGDGVLLSTNNSYINKKLGQYADFRLTNQKSAIVEYSFNEERFLWAKMFLESEKAYTEKKISIEEYRKLSKRERF